MAARGGGRAAAFWARTDVRRRWRSLVVLGVLIGLTAGFALSAWAGARRTDTALERLRQQTNAADAVAFPSQVGKTHPNWAPLAARPEVATVAVWDLLFGNANGQPGAVIFASAAAVVVDRAVIKVGSVGAPVFSVRPISGASATPITFTLTSGRAPRGRGEAAIGPATAKDLHVGIGDTVSVGASGARVRIVGEALFPDDVHAEFDGGLWLAPVQFDAVVPPIGPKGSLLDARLVAVRFAPGAPLRAAIGHLQSELGPLAQDISPPSPPTELTNLQNVRTRPEVLAAFLGLIAVAALGSVLLSCARRRSHEFAVLRALGMTRGNIRTVLNSQGTAIGLFGLVVGIPLGLAVGRLGWRAIAERVPLSEIAPFALVAALLLIPVILVAANVLALWPGRVTLSHLPAEELRAE